MRDCNKCVYSTRDGDCRKFDCIGTVTVDDIRAEERTKVINEFENKLSKILERILKKYKEHSE